MRPGQTSHSNSTHFVAPDLNSAGAIHLPFPRASSITPIRCQKRQFGRVTSRTIFDSSVGQPQNYRGGTRKPVGWQAGCAESVPLKLSGITGLTPSGREAPCTWKPLSRPIESPRYCALHIPDPAAPLHTFPSGLSRACRTGRKKLIFSSTVVKDSSCARVLANAMLIAASAISQGIPPCSVPIGFACSGRAAKTTVARPAAMSFASNRIRRATGTSFVFARSCERSS
jgi:hypothetical protein